VEEDEAEFPAQTTGQVTSTSEPNPDSSERTEHLIRPTGRGCFYLEGLIGFILTFSVVVTSVSIEFSSAIVYCLAAGFHYVASIGKLLIFMKAIILLVAHSLMIFDAVLLTVSVVATEILGAVTMIVT
jgi:hypothetical protein